MRVIVFVEGPSDVLAMQALLSSLLEKKRGQGVSVEFYKTENGDRKRALLLKVPVKAAHILRTTPGTVVVAMPDLYPKNKGFPHETFPELVDGIRQRLDAALKDKGLEPRGFLNRFHVFCFKHDLEVLLLAAAEQLMSRLGVERLHSTWRLPVEDQDHDRPPKRIIEDLFRLHSKRYVDTLDARRILAGADYRVLAGRCDQCFGPFVAFIEGLQPASPISPPAL